MDGKRLHKWQLLCNEFISYAGTYPIQHAIGQAKIVAEKAVGALYADDQSQHAYWVLNKLGNNNTPKVNAFKRRFKEFI